MSGFVEKLKIPIYVNSTGNFAHYTYGISGFAEQLNIQNSVNSTEICVP